MNIFRTGAYLLIILGFLVNHIHSVNVFDTFKSLFSGNGGKNSNSNLLIGDGSPSHAETNGVRSFDSRKGEKNRNKASRKTDAQKSQTNGNVPDIAELKEVGDSHDSVISGRGNNEHQNEEGSGSHESYYTEAGSNNRDSQVSSQEHGKNPQVQDAYSPRDLIDTASKDPIDTQTFKRKVQPKTAPIMGGKGSKNIDENTSNVLNKPVNTHENKKPQQKELLPNEKPENNNHHKTIMIAEDRKTDAEESQTNDVNVLNIAESKVTGGGKVSVISDSRNNADTLNQANTKSTFTGQSPSNEEIKGTETSLPKQNPEKEQENEQKPENNESQQQKNILPNEKPEKEQENEQTPENNNHHKSQQKEPLPNEKPENNNHHKMIAYISAGVISGVAIISLSIVAGIRTRRIKRAQKSQVFVLI